MNKIVIGCFIFSIFFHTSLILLSNNKNVSVASSDTPVVITPKENLIDISLISRASKGKPSIPEEISEPLDLKEKPIRKPSKEGVEKKKKKENKIKKNMPFKEVNALAEVGEGAENIEALAEVAASASYVPEPKYPVVSLRNGQEGSVVVGVELDEEGKIVRSFIASSSGYPKLDEAALAVLPAARFAPAKKGGRNVPSSLNLSFHFDIKKQHN